MNCRVQGWVDCSLHGQEEKTKTRTGQVIFPKIPQMRRIQTGALHPAPSFSRDHAHNHLPCSCSSQCRARADARLGQEGVCTSAQEQLPFCKAEHNPFIDEPFLNYLPHVYKMICECCPVFNDSLFTRNMLFMEAERAPLQTR